GETLPSPRRVRFAAEVAQHLLRWEPGHGCPSNTRYSVEYRVYGSSISWMSVPECGNTSGHSCDLTHYTPDPQQRYYARVRAVCGNHTSPWRRTSAFSPQEASLRLSGQSLSVVGNSIQVQLQLLLHPGNSTVEFNKFLKRMVQYQVHVRRAQDNHTFTVVENAAEFTIRDLFWATRYCLSVEPRLPSRPTLGRRSEEQCVTTGHRDRSTELLPSILGSSFTMLLLLGALLAYTYLRKPVRTPSVLKSYMKQSSLWVEHEPPSSSSLDPDPIQQLFLCQKEPQLGSSANSGTSTAQLPLEQAWKLPAWPKDQPCLLGPPGSRENSGTSTDSGICLQLPSSSSSSLSCSVGPEPQGYRQQLPTGEDSGVGLESPWAAPGCCSGSGNGSPGDVEFRGYLQQCKASLEPERDTGRALPLPGCAGPGQGPGSTGTVLDTERSELAVSKGYLKQSSPHGHTQDLAPWGAPAWDSASQGGPQFPTLLSWVAPDAPLTCKGSPELLKAPLDPSIFSTGSLGTLPLISSLSSEWLTLPAKPLSQLSGDSKDSRL
ncbi:I10R1 protein, partial [Climacteris rufus]|nr:I10R1 protein [Climacteris rufus]